jgi:hypothetical protein
MNDYFNHALNIIKDAYDRGNGTPHLGKTYTWPWRERNKEIKQRKEKKIKENKK